jgi:hypothetical protein
VFKVCRKPNNGIEISIILIIINNKIIIIHIIIKLNYNRND